MSEPRSDQEYEDIEMDSQGVPQFPQSPTHRPPVPLPGQLVAFSLYC